MHAFCCIAGFERRGGTDWDRRSQRLELLHSGLISFAAIRLALCDETSEYAMTSSRQNNYIGTNEINCCSPMFQIALPDSPYHTSNQLH